jgi:hypothetical protein
MKDESWEFLREDADEFDRKDSVEAVERGDLVGEGENKKVYAGKRQDVFSPVEGRTLEGGTSLKRVYHDLRESPRVVNTWLFHQELPESDGVSGILMVQQDDVPDNFEEVMESEGLEHVVSETVNVWEEILDEGYIYCDLAPENIKFWNGYGMAVDYMDSDALMAVESVSDLGMGAARSYDLFVNELSSEYGVDRLEAERLVVENSDQLDPDRLTGDPYLDFHDVFEYSDSRE